MLRTNALSEPLFSLETCEHIDVQHTSQSVCIRTTNFDPPCARCWEGGWLEELGVQACGQGRNPTPASNKIASKGHALWGTELCFLDMKRDGEGTHLGGKQVPSGLGQPRVPWSFINIPRSDLYVLAVASPPTGSYISPELL